MAPGSSAVASNTVISPSGYTRTSPRVSPPSTMGYSPYIKNTPVPFTQAYERDGGDMPFHIRACSAARRRRLRQSAIMAMNSLLVGLPLMLETV